MPKSAQQSGSTPSRMYWVQLSQMISVASSFANAVNSAWYKVD